MILFESIAIFIYKTIKKRNEMIKELFTETIFNQPHTITLNVYSNGAVKIWEVKHDYRRLLVTWSEDEATEMYEREVKKLQYDRECVEAVKKLDEKDKEKEDNEWSVADALDFIDENEEYSIVIGKIPSELKGHPERIRYCSFNNDLDHWMTVVKL